MRKFAAVIACLFVLLSEIAVDAGRFENVMKRAVSGDVKAQYSLGVMYADGLGVAQNYSEAVK